MIKIFYQEPEDQDFIGSILPLSKNVSKFPCGESNVKVGPYKVASEWISIRFDYKEDSDLIELLLTVDALKRVGHKAEDMTLHIGYFPYGRQDRVCNPGEPHSLKVICQLINSMGLGTVLVEDPHSDVVEALIDNVQIIDMYELLYMSDMFMGDILGEFDMFVSPDAGAYKKVGKVAGKFQKPVIRADKVRDTTTGTILDIEVYATCLTGQRVTILDDICDGGGTFIGLAKKLKEKGAREVSLYTTHGMYTKGVEVLLKNGVDKVICKNYYGPLDDQHQVIILD